MKNRLPILLLSTLLFSVLLALYPNKNTARFKSGEEAIYKIQYGKHAAAGICKVSLQEVSFMGSPHYLLKLEGNSLGTLDKIISVKANIASYTERENFSSSKINMLGHLGVFIKENIEEVYSQPTKTLIIKDHIKNKIKKVNLSQQEEFRDIAGFCYYLRTQKLYEAKIGTSYVNNFYADEGVFPLKIRVGPTEVVQTKFGKLRCVKIIPDIPNDPKTGKKFPVTVEVWATANEQGVPVLIKIQSDYGAVTTYLDSYKNLFEPLVPLP